MKRMGDDVADQIEIEASQKRQAQEIQKLLDEAVICGLRYIVGESPLYRYIIDLASEGMADDGSVTIEPRGLGKFLNHAESGLGIKAMAKLKEACEDMGIDTTSTLARYPPENILRKDDEGLMYCIEEGEIVVWRETEFAAEHGQFMFYVDVSDEVEPDAITFMAAALAPNEEDVSG